MLRNDDGADAVRGFVLLNEVLSLNAQECVQAIDTSLVFDPQ